MNKILKTNILLTALVTLLLTSCESKTNLAKNVEGTWATNAEKIKADDALEATATYMIQFTPSDGTNPLDGKFDMAALVEITNMAAPSDAVEQAYSVSAGGIASLQGSYTIKDDDDIAIVTDASSFNVSVDPKGVILVNNIIDESNTPVVNDSLSQIYSTHVKEQIASVLQQKMLCIRKIEDIKFKNNSMKCEINDVHFTFEKQ